MRIIKLSIMNIKEITFGENAREKILNGVNLVADAVSSTMGAKGRNVLIETEGGLPKITKDGVSVSRSIFLEDPIESVGAELIKQSAKKTVDDCGDSTTSTVVLAREFMRLAHEEVNNGAHPILLQKGMVEAVKQAIKQLEDSSVKLTQKDYSNVATISANNDRELGDVIAKAFKLAGKNGVVNYERSLDEKTFVAKSSGLKIERGFKNSFMATDKKSNKIEMDSPYVFVCEKKIEALQQILPLLKKSKEEDRWILILGEMEQTVLNLLMTNIIKHNLKIRFIEAPNFGSKRSDLLSDISVATGAVMVRNQGTDNIEAVCTKYLGSCDNFVSTSKESFINVNKELYQDDIDKEIKVLKELKKKSDSGLAKDFLEERIAKLSCSIATIYVGAVSDVEMEEKIDRVDDAVNAMKSAIEEGILSGGGLALFNASYKLNCNREETSDFIKGFCLAKKAMRKPMYQIVENAGLEVDLDDDENIGLNVLTGEKVNMFEAGIIDPHKVIRCALQNSASVAQTFLMTNTVINIKRNK